MSKNKTTNQSNYQKEYKKRYSSQKKIITFPLDNAFYNELYRRSYILDITVNSFAKSIITSYLNNEKPIVLTDYQTNKINEYIHISRGIANNINQIAHNSNMGLGVDTNMLLQALKKYEDNFASIIQKLSDDYQIN